MNEAQENLLRTINGRPVLIWGARMTGIGFLRFAMANHLDVKGFVDGDPSLAGRKVGGFPVGLPGGIAPLRLQHKGLVIVIAVSIKEDEIVTGLKRLGVPDEDFIRYSNFCGHFFTIDVSGVCNLKCPSCAQGMKGFETPKGLMPKDDFVKVTEKMVRETQLVSHVCLYSWGEPLLHPDLGFFIEHLHGMGLAVAVSTNLSIPHSDKVEKMVQASPDYLKVSLSGYYPEVYNSTHTGGNIDLVKSNLYRIKYFIEKYRSPIFVDVNYHMYNNNIGIDLTKMKELCDELGFVLSPCYANVTPVERLIEFCEGKPDAHMQKLDDLLLVRIEKGLEIAKPYNDLPCRFLTNQVNINWDKSVSLCCVCFDRGLATVSKNYLSEPMTEISRRKQDHPMCTKCSRYAISPYLLGVNQKAWELEASRTMGGALPVSTVG